MNPPTLAEELLAAEGSWEQTVFFRSVAPGRLHMLQWLALHKWTQWVIKNQLIKRNALCVLVNMVTSMWLMSTGHGPVWPKSSAVTFTLT